MSVRREDLRYDEVESECRLGCSLSLAHFPFGGGPLTDAHSRESRALGGAGTRDMPAHHPGISAASKHDHSKTALLGQPGLVLRATDDCRARERCPAPSSSVDIRCATRSSTLGHLATHHMCLAHEPVSHHCRIR
jgi:hypothetical protein